jgi:hypothetical protein
MIPKPGIFLFYSPPPLFKEINPNSRKLVGNKHSPSSPQFKCLQPPTKRNKIRLWKYRTILPKGLLKLRIGGRFLPKEKSMCLKIWLLEAPTNKPWRQLHTHTHTHTHTHPHQLMPPDQETLSCFVYNEHMTL